MTNRATIMGHIDEVMDQYCHGCLLKRTLNKERGKTAAHRFCIQGCTIGDQLRFLGNEMNKMSK